MLLVYLFFIGLLVFFFSFIIRNKFIKTCMFLISFGCVIPSLIIYGLFFLLIASLSMETVRIGLESVSPNNAYKVQIKNRSTSGGFSGDGGTSQDYLLVKRNWYLPIHFYNGKIGSCDAVGWSEDSSILAVWQQDECVVVYDMEEKKVITIDDPPKPKHLIAKGKSKFEPSTQQYAIDLEDMFVQTCERGDLEPVKYIDSVYKIDPNELFKGIKRAYYNEQMNVVQYLNEKYNIPWVNEKWNNKNLDKNDVDSILFRSFISNQYEIVEKLFEQDKISENETLGFYLYLSAQHKQDELFKLLLSKVDDKQINFQNIFGFTPLSISAQKGYYDYVVDLVEQGADLEIPDYFKSSPKTALTHALNNGHNNIAEYLIEHGAKVQYVDIGHQLFQSCLHGNKNYFEMLIKKASFGNVNHHDIDELTPLIIASQKGHLDIVKLLVKAGADVNAEDVSGETAIYHAMYNQHYEIVEYLLRNDADPSVIGMHGSSFIDHPKMQGIINKIANEE